MLHASVLGLLTAAIPLKAIGAAALLAIPEGDEDDIVVDPSAVETDRARSVHVLGFTSQDELLFAESEGTFSTSEWAKVLDLGQRICCQHQQAGFDTAMAGDSIESRGMKDFIRSVMETKVAADLYWK